MSRDKRTTIDGYKFNSIAESKRYRELKLLQKAGKIMELEVRPRFELHAGDILILTYEPVFSYHDVHNEVFGPSRGQLHIEDVEDVDVKGVGATLFILKKKLFYANYWSHVEEIRAR